MNDNQADYTAIFKNGRLPSINRITCYSRMQYLEWYWYTEQLLLFVLIFRSMKKEKRLNIEYMFMTLGSIVGRLLHLKRTCPKCKRDQIVPSAKKHETVSCKFCGAKIPPPGK